MVRIASAGIRLFSTFSLDYVNVETPDPRADLRIGISTPGPGIRLAAVSRPGGVPPVLEGEDTVTHSVASSNP